MKTRSQTAPKGWEAFDSEARLLGLRAARGDMTARHRLTERCMPVVVKAATRFLRKGPEWDDLVQVAALAVFQATGEWNPDATPVPFVVWATVAVKRDLQRYVYQEQPHRLVRVPIPERRRMPTEEHVKRLAEAWEQYSSRVDITELTHFGAEVPRHEYEFDELEKLRGLLAELSERDRGILLRRANGEKLIDVGKIFRLSSCTVSQIEQRSLKHLQDRWVETSHPQTPIGRSPCMLSAVWPPVGRGPVRKRNRGVEPPPGWADLLSWLAAVRDWCRDHRGRLKQLANALGIGPPMVSRWLAVRQLPSQRRVDAIAKWLEGQSDWMDSASVG
jgi:RNA polymerase sigma factor (sigma-70 family)